MTTEELTEAEKMRRVPGIYFTDGPAGRRATVSGTGTDVFEIIKEYHSVGDDWRRLRKGFYWLTPAQLEAALTYYAEFPEEINERLARKEEITPEYLRARFPGKSF